MEYQDFKGVATLGLESFMLLPKCNHCFSGYYTEFLYRLGFYNTEPYVEMLKQVVDEWVSAGWIERIDVGPNSLGFFITDKFYEDFGYSNIDYFKSDWYTNIRPLNLGQFFKEGE